MKRFRLTHYGEGSEPIAEFGPISAPSIGEAFHAFRVEGALNVDADVVQIVVDELAD